MSWRNKLSRDGKMYVVGAISVLIVLLIGSVLVSQALRVEQATKNDSKPTGQATQTAQVAQQATQTELEKVTCRWTGTSPSPHLEMCLIESPVAQPKASRCSSRNSASVECSISLPPNGVFTAFVTVLDASDLTERGDALSGMMSCSSAQGAVPVMGPPQRRTATFGGWMPRAH